MSVKIAGQHIFGSPFKPTVKAGYSDPRGCVQIRQTRKPMDLDTPNPKTDALGPTL